MNTNSKYGIPHERRPKDDEKTSTEVKSLVRWRLQLSNEVLLELIDWRVGDTDDYLQRSLRITPGGEDAQPINIEGLDIDAFLLVVSKLRPEPIHPAERRIYNKALKAYKRHEDLPRPSKLAYYGSDMKSAEDLGRDIARTFKDEVQLPIASEEEHLAEYALHSYVGVANAITIDGERWVVNKVANKLKLTLSGTTAASGPESVVIDEKALMCADEPLVELVRRRIAESRKTN